MNEKEKEYNCPTCRYNCAPELKVKATCFQTIHCNLHEPKSRLCPKCGSEMLGHWLTDFDEYMGETFNYYRCPKCGHEEKVGGDPSVH